MRNIKYLILLLIVLVINSMSAYSQDYTKDVIELWDANNIPFNKDSITLEEMLDEEDKRFSQISKPCIYLYKKTNLSKAGSALLICPGGGYAVVSIGKDRGETYAKKFLEMGFNVVAVLKYRLPDSNIVNEQYKVPLCDAQKALSIMHKNAKKWKVDKNKIGVMGGSAGGHLAASLANLTNDIVAPGVKKKDLKQAFSILMYPVISFNLPYRHKGSFGRMLYDKSKDQELLDYYSMENRVSAETPSTYLLHATDDQSVSYKNSIIYAEQLKKYNIPYTYVELEKGGHGFGLNRSRVNKDWLPELEKWVLETLDNIEE